ncbi:MAG: PQQ-like beta-propeller repeat protein [Cyclobacteriaceae bacterium]|nr:PQQ-like beta-propeller repeat protein [Cyclobacteriaceae bacterium]
MKAPNPSAIIYILCSFAFINTSIAQAPHGFRGPERNGIYPESGLAKTWPNEGPELLWESMDAYAGYSSPVIVGDRVYITGINSAQTEEIFSAYTIDGKKVYQVTYGKTTTTSYRETRSTPTIEGSSAYLISGSGEVVCINVETGKVGWKVDGNLKFSKSTGTWGTAESPLVFDNKVIYSPGGSQTAVVALNKENGETIWKSKTLGNNSSYVSPLLIKYNGKRQIIGLTDENVIGVNPENGNIEWSYHDWARGTRYKIAPNTPIYKNGKLFICQGYDAGSFMLQLNNDLTGVKELWRNDDLDTHHGGQVLINDVLYGSNWISNSQGNWVAVDWNTGKTLFEEPWSGGKSKGSIIAADNMMYCYDERRGAVGLVKPNMEKFDVVSEFRITKGEGPHWAHPVIKDGILYLRHGSALMAYNIKQ